MNSFTIKNGDVLQKKLGKHFSGFPKIASYRKDSCRIGQWSLKRFTHRPVKGYFSALSEEGEGVALLKGGVTWMSLTPLEIESHLMAHHSAKGRVVVVGLGLGLGMIALSILKKASVKQLTIIDIDDTLLKSFPDILDDSERQYVLDSIETGRLRMVCADCCAALPVDLVAELRGADYLWIDIWPELGTDQAYHDAMRLQSQLKAKCVDYWGIELHLCKSFASSYDVKPTQLGNRMARLKNHFAKVVESHPMPISAKTLDKRAFNVYFEMCILVSMNLRDTLGSRMGY